MQCPRCHTEIRDGLKFCEDCGARLGPTCAQCGAELTSGKRFCGSCGAPVVGQTPDRFAAPEVYTPKHLAEKILTSRSALEGERKQVTVLFADLKGSLELLADHNPELAREYLAPEAKWHGGILGTVESRENITGLLRIFWRVSRPARI